MKKAHVEKLEHMAATYLQFMYGKYLKYRNDCGDTSEAARVMWQDYAASCNMLIAFGATWTRKFNGTAGQDDWDISNYEHRVEFPTDAQCEKLNRDVWTK